MIFAAPRDKKFFSKEKKRMNYKKLKLFSVVVLASLLLTACGAISSANWPGVSPDPSSKFVYVAYGTYVFKVDASNGSMVWRYPDAAGSKQFYAPPGASDSFVVVGDITDGLTGVDASTKAEKWTNTQAQGKWIAGSIVAGNIIIAPSSDGDVFALSATDGNKEIWKYKASGPFWANPVSDGKVVYAPSMDHFLYALNVEDGSLAWKKDLGAATVYGLTLTQDGTIYISTLANEVLSLKASNGDINWRFKAKGNLWAVPVENNGVVYIGDLNNKVYAINSSDGTSKWEVDGGAPITSAPAITPDGLIFGTENGTIFKMNFDGTRTNGWSQTINSGKLYSAPVITAGNLVVFGILPNAATDPILVAYDFTGKQAWTFIMPK